MIRKLIALLALGLLVAWLFSFSQWQGEETEFSAENSIPVSMLTDLLKKPLEPLLAKISEQFKNGGESWSIIWGVAQQNEKLAPYIEQWSGVYESLEPSLEPLREKLESSLP